MSATIPFSCLPRTVFILKGGSLEPFFFFQKFLPGVLAGARSFQFCLLVWTEIFKVLNFHSLNCIKRPLHRRHPPPPHTHTFLFFCSAIYQNDSFLLERFRILRGGFCHFRSLRVTDSSRRASVLLHGITDPAPARKNSARVKLPINCDPSNSISSLLLQGSIFQRAP